MQTDMQFYCIYRLTKVILTEYISRHYEIVETFLNIMI